MVRHFFITACFLLGITASAQEIIDLSKSDDSGIEWSNPEKEFYSNIWKTQVVTNVSHPTMQVFRPKAEDNTGAAVVVAPGGGMYALSIVNEGTAVAEWLAKKGVTAFVLKYRLVPTGDDGTAEIMTTTPATVLEKAGNVLPFAITDGLNAIVHVRENAKKYGVDPNKIGFLGFSAGGAVTMGVGYNYSKENRPNFLVPVYAWTDAQPVLAPKNDAPPMLIVCASNDPLGLAKGSVELYSSMLEANKNVSLMMYSKGGHGFGMYPQGVPSDTWIERFHDWALSENLIPKPIP
ncbi:MAG: alpha/beta hydrolase [Bacteroidota bacterium]